MIKPAMHELSLMEALRDQPASPHQWVPLIRVLPQAGLTAAQGGESPVAFQLRQGAYVVDTGHPLLCCVPDLQHPRRRLGAGGTGHFSFPLDQFVDFIQGRHEDVSGIEACPVQLPIVNGFGAGLSGAEYRADRRSLVFATSGEVEGDSCGDSIIFGTLWA